jgi:hypothetical protein
MQRLRCVDPGLLLKFAQKHKKTSVCINLLHQFQQTLNQAGRRSRVGAGILCIKSTAIFGAPVELLKNWPSAKLDIGAGMWIGFPQARQFLRQA